MEDELFFDVVVEGKRVQFFGEGDVEFAYDVEIHSNSLLFQDVHGLGDLRQAAGFEEDAYVEDAEIVRALGDVIFVEKFVVGVIQYGGEFRSFCAVARLI